MHIPTFTTEDIEGLPQPGEITSLSELQAEGQDVFADPEHRIDSMLYFLDHVRATKPNDEGEILPWAWYIHDHEDENVDNDQTNIIGWFNDWHSMISPEDDYGEIEGCLSRIVSIPGTNHYKITNSKRDLDGNIIHENNWIVEREDAKAYLKTISQVRVFEYDYCYELHMSSGVDPIYF